MSDFQFTLFEPKSNWRPPASLPDLSHVRELAIDTECRDPNLHKRGPGFTRADGHVAGISIATDTGFRGYFPIGHQGGGNLDSDLVQLFLRDAGKNTSTEFIFANAAYDLGWLRTLGVEICGPVHDISIADPLIDEENPDGYGLNALGLRWLGEGKDETLLDEAAKAFGIDPKADMWRLHPRFVGGYAETDADRTLRIWAKQKVALRAQGLWPIYELEQSLIKTLFEMHWRGIRVDTAYATQLNETWRKREKQLFRELMIRPQDLWSSDYITNKCRRLGITLPKTAPTEGHPEGQDSAKKDFLTSLNHPEINPFLELRAIERVRSVYLEQNLIQNVHRGRIFPQYTQLARDDGGTRTGRLSCKNPNAQQFPKRSKLFDAKLLRKSLIPEEGCRWAKADYWSQEPVIQLHYAMTLGLSGTEKVRQAFLRGEKLATFIEKATDGKVNYDEAKALTLGRSYGMGKAKMAQSVGMSLDECDSILTAFDGVVPFIRGMANQASDAAAQRGWIRTLAGRKRHFNLFTPIRNWDAKFKNPFDDKRKFKAYPLEEAREVYKLKNGEPAMMERAFTYKAFNALCQGSAADQTKTAMVMINSAIGLPQSQVHDEINKSVQDEKEANTMAEIMTHCIPLLSPVKVELDLGDTWQ